MASTRRKLIVGNWKLHKTVEESLALASQIAEGFKRDDVDALICPTFTALYPVAQALKGLAPKVGAQNMYWEDLGAFTGEVSGPLLKAAGASHVIIGHSERRQLFGESERSVSKRLAAAWRARLTPILCVGELLEERQGGQTEGVLESQLAGALAGVTTAQAADLVIAYEPVWAIGTGLTASCSQANQAHAHIRAWLTSRFNKQLAYSAKILYGGSVKMANAANLLSQSEVDGVLVGGAALTSESFLSIIHTI
jgi:triosephosphate isomerase